MNIHLTKSCLIKNILGVIYEMAPGCKPRNIDKIHKYVLDWCDKNVKDYQTEVNSKDLNKYLKDMLMACEEFTQLNISQKKWDEGVKDCNDKRNSGFSAVFVSHDNNGDVSSIYTPHEYNDFIDLGALIPNIASAIIYDKQNSEDCFLCKFAGKYGNMEPTNCEECKTCCINPTYRFNKVYHPKALLPRNSEEYKNYKED